MSTVFNNADLNIFYWDITSTTLFLFMHFDWIPLFVNIGQFFEQTTLFRNGVFGIIIATQNKTKKKIFFVSFWRKSKLRLINLQIFLVSAFTFQWVKLATVIGLYLVVL